MYEQSPVLGQLVERVWRDATAALMDSLVTESTQTVLQLVEAVICRVVEETSRDEALEILGEVLLIEEKTLPLRPFQDRVLSGTSPAEAVRGLIQSFLKTAVVAVAAAELRGRKALLQDDDSLKVDYDCPEVEVGRELLQLVLERWPELMGELGERTRDILAYTYGVTPRATAGPFEPDEIGDPPKVRLTFERLLWAFYLSRGFTQPAAEWTGKPVKAGEAHTLKGPYKNKTARRDFLEMILRERPVLLRRLTGNQLAALSRAFPFVGAYKWEGRDPRSWDAIVRQACLELLWGYFLSERSRGSN